MTTAAGDDLMSRRNKRKGFEDLIARRQELSDVSPPWTDTPPVDSVPQPTAPTGPPTGTAVPAPYAGQHEGELTEQERVDLATCEVALDNLRMAFWAAGKALQTIRDARLYRDSHPTFEAYLADRWDMSHAQAYRLIEGWPLAERLSAMGDKLNERQVRALLPIADQHGPDAAVTVYRTITETDGIRVTAAVILGAVAALPADRFDPADPGLPGRPARAISINVGNASRAVGRQAAASVRCSAGSGRTSSGRPWPRSPRRLVNWRLNPASSPKRSRRKLGRPAP